MSPQAPYKPIADYGVIGNLQTAALVGTDGSIDWCCFPDVDSPSVFGAILDHRRGGRFRVSLGPGGSREQRYVEHTNVLETVFTDANGRLTVTDFMPLRGSLDDAREIATAPEIHRVLHCQGGAVEVELEWAPRFDYSRGEGRIQRVEGGFLATSGGQRLVLCGDHQALEIEGDAGGPLVRARFKLADGERLALVTRWDSTDGVASLEDSLRALDDTRQCWLDWVHKEAATGGRDWAHPWSEQVVRCELALKLMIYSPTGAIVAAPTTSLPETLGGVRNWDYRYSWIRDAALSAQALFSMGHAAGATDFIHWAERTARQRSDADWKMHILYGVRGEIDLPEVELEHLEGYAGSRPVVMGNAAAPQLQLDIFGELISAAYEVARVGGDLEPEVWSFLPWVADQACRMWREPDYGIWEVRSGPAHFVYSKAMVWMALDRAARLAAMGRIQGDADRWRRVGREIQDRVLREGYDAEAGAFTQVFGSRDLDASNLLIPMMELLPLDDPRVQGTIDRTLEELTVNDLVYRYRADDGLPGQEGAFSLCTFWLVDVLALSGRLDEAHRVFEGMVGRANHLGLYSEQIDPNSGLFLGNFPQTFTHVGLINSAIYLAYAEGRPLPFPDPIGSREHRAQGIMNT